MKTKTVIAALLTSAGFAMAAPASAIIVGGIDFGTLGLTQELETTTFAETTVFGTGQSLQGYGVVSTVNGDSTYCANNTANCTLYFYFHGYTAQTFTASDVTFTGGQIDVYYSGAPAVNFLTQSSTANIAFIQSQTPWVELTGHTFTDPIFNTSAGLPAGTSYTLNGHGQLTGASLTETGAGQVDVAFNSFGMPDVQNFLNGNSIIDGLGGFADKTFSGESNSTVHNPNDVCSLPTDVPGQFCLQGSASLRGLTHLVPEPASLALLGVGLVGLGFVRRRNRS